MWSNLNDEWFPCYDAQGNEIRQYDTVFICLIVILSSLLAPIVFGPVDFVKNIVRYLLGMIMYICMLPLYTTILPIYSICNTHQISWGNRPKVAQYQQLSVVPTTQKSIVENLKIKRLFFFCLWVAFNLIYIFVVETFLAESKTISINSG